MTVRVLVFGKVGQLGWELQRTLACLGAIDALEYPEVDFTRPESLRGLIENRRPNLVINATGYTAVDRAESDVDSARKLNASAVDVLAREARASRAAFIHISTDYVFDGKKGSPYTEDDQPHPLSVYGLTKWEGEQAVEAAGGAWLVLRTAWVYSTRRDSFVTKVLGWARSQERLRVVADQVSNPTWARMLAEMIALLTATAGADPFGYLQERSGIYHLAGGGYASRMEWAQEILRLDPQPEKRLAKQVEPALTADFPTPAVRPLFSALDCTKFEKVFGLSMPDWRQGLALAMAAQE